MPQIASNALEYLAAMKKPEFNVQVLGFRDLQEIRGAWAPADFTLMLENLDFGETGAMSDPEIREMALLALQDIEPVAAAEFLLTHHLGDRLKSGQIQNAANEMLEEKLWEEYADLSLHEAMFNVASLLYAAFPREFSEPDAIHVTLEVSAATKAGQDVLEGPLNESFVVRLLADGMADNSVLHRLFEDQLKGQSFPEADKIVWILEVDASKAPTIKIEVTSSGCWLDPLRDTKSFSSSAHLDDDMVN